MTDTAARADAELVTITGTVVSRVDEVLVGRTDRGNLTSDLDKSTEMPADVVPVDGPSAEFSIRVPFRVTAVELDPACQVLRWTPEYRVAADSVRAGAPGR